MSSYPSGIIYTTEDQGKWEGKAGGHAPKTEVSGGKITITTEHAMTEAHFIVRHTLVTDDGKVVGEKTFSPSDEKAISEFEVPEGAKKLYATSFCNLHDMWLTEVAL